MRRVLYLLLLAPTLCLLAPASWAAGQATPDEAKAMAIKAAEYLKSVGPEKAFAEFSAKDGPWHDRDLYVSVLDENGVTVAHGANPGLIGRDTLELKDPDGKAFLHEVAAIGDEGWVDYRWQNPLTKAIESKTVFGERVGGYVVCVGAYRN